MSDYLLELGRRPLAKKLIRQLNLPVPLPEPLLRATAAWSDQELRGVHYAVGGSRLAAVTPVLKEILHAAGAALVEGGAQASGPLEALLFDGTGLTTTSELGSLFDFIKPRLRALRNGGRVLLLAAATSPVATPEAAACSAGIVGFAKSLAKEIGRKGATCQVLFLHAKTRSAAALRAPVLFFLSPRSAFISGQTLHISDVHPDATAPLSRSLSGHTALVTGAAHGIGAAVCRHLAAEGAELFGHDRPQEKTELSRLMAELGGHSLCADLLDPHGMRLLLEQIETLIGPLDILVNNAGMTRDKMLVNMPRDYWDDTLAVNLGAPIALSEALLNKPEGFKNGGRILFMSSISGLAGNAGQSNYATAKAGLAGYVAQAAALHSAREITVNALAPGFIETRMTASIPFAVREVARRFNALKQSGLPKDVAEAATFFALPAAGGISGQVLRVCGHNLLGA